MQNRSHEAKIADFDMQFIINQYIVTLDVAVYNPKAVHVAEGLGDVFGDLDAGLVR